MVNGADTPKARSPLGVFAAHGLATAFLAAIIVGAWEIGGGWAVAAFVVLAAATLTIGNGAGEGE